MAGIDASTMTSLGTCRLVMPLSESTMASSGPAASSASNDALISSASSSTPMPAMMPPSPSLGLSPAAARAAPWSAKVLGKNARTT